MKTNPPTHEDIAQRAHEIWLSHGNPHGFDIGHWLEAERQLAVGSGGGVPPIVPVTVPLGFRHAPATGTPGPSPDELAAKAELQKHAARAPQSQHGKNGPKAAPTESGKPLWDKPHSS